MFRVEPLYHCPEFADDDELVQGNDKGELAWQFQEEPEPSVLGPRQNQHALTLFKDRQQRIDKGVVDFFPRRLVDERLAVMEVESPSTDAPQDGPVRHERLV